VLALTAVQPLRSRYPGTPGPSAQGDTSVTIYNNDLALVQDTRQITLTRAEPAGVPRRADPPRDGDARRARRKHRRAEFLDYDLLSAQALMNKAVGQSVTVVRTNPATVVETRESARVLANNGGIIIPLSWLSRRSRSPCSIAAACLSICSTVCG